MTTPTRMALSLAVGWAADRPLPRVLRAPLYRAFARFTGADVGEARDPLASYPSLGEFFVRHLKPGARRPDPSPDALCSPVDGTVQSVGPIADGCVLQAKGRPYPLRELLGGPTDGVLLEGGHQWTIYLSPRDYHRIHTPLDCELVEARWIRGARYSVAGPVLDRRMVLPINERVVLRLDSSFGTFFLVLVGALNVGRMRVIGVDPERAGWIDPPIAFAKGAELARFEMGSTIVLIAPRGVAVQSPAMTPGAKVKLGERIGKLVAIVRPSRTAQRA